MFTGLRNELENRLNFGLGLAFLRIIPVIISDHRQASSARCKSRSWRARQNYRSEPNVP